MATYNRRHVTWNCKTMVSWQYVTQRKSISHRTLLRAAPTPVTRRDSARIRIAGRLAVLALPDHCWTAAGVCRDRPVRTIQPAVAYVGYRTALRRLLSGAAESSDLRRGASLYGNNATSRRLRGRAAGFCDLNMVPSSGMPMARLK